jgi:hypothetical protein
MPFQFRSLLADSYAQPVDGCLHTKTRLGYVADEPDRVAILFITGT